VVLERSDVRLCITIVTTINDRFKDDCMKNFLQHLKDLGADDDNINKLITNNVAFWSNESVEQQETIAVEIIKGKAKI